MCSHFWHNGEKFNRSWPNRILQLCILTLLSVRKSLLPIIHFHQTHLFFHPFNTRLRFSLCAFCVYSLFPPFFTSLQLLPGFSVIALNHVLCGTNIHFLMASTFNPNRPLSSTDDDRYNMNHITLLSQCLIA